MEAGQWSAHVLYYTHLHVGSVDIGAVSNHIGDRNNSTSLDQWTGKTVRYPGENDLVR